MAEQKDSLFHGRVGGGNQWMYLQKNATQETKIMEALTDKYTAELKKRQEAELEARKALELARAQGDKAAIEREKIRLKEAQRLKLEYETEFQEKKQSIQETASRVAEIYEQNRYKAMSKREQLQYQRDVKQKLETERSERQKHHAQLIAEEQHLQNVLRRENLTEEERKATESRLSKVQESMSTTSDDIGKYDSEISKVDTLIDHMFSAVATRAEKATEASNKYKEAEEKRAQAHAALEAAQASRDDALRKAKEEGRKLTDEEIKALNNEVATKKEAADASDLAAQSALDLKTSAEESAKGFKTLEQAQQEQAEEEKKQKEQHKKNQKELLEFVSADLDALYGKQGRMMGRLQGSGESWSGLVLDVMTTVGLSGFVSQKGVVAKMVSLVDSGVAYNLEMRAFLSEVSENIAATFDATNGTLLRLIRLQQSDSTAARLGMEASLTKLFNQFFQDTSYLANDISDSVAAAILDASATMNTNESLEFEYTLQKWLGSLYSIGMSSDAVTEIAKGINYLGTGDVSALNSNNALQTLLAMSAARAGGKSYAEMLLTGIDSDDTNKLLKAMVEYLAEIADSQTNYVTKSAYANLFNMSVTDLNTFRNLTTSEINSLYKNNTSYNKLMTETQNQLAQVITRMNMSQIVDTMFENAKAGASATIGSNPVTYAMYKALATIHGTTGGVKIPGITGMGTGFSSDMDLINIMTSALIGLGLVGSAIGGVSSMFSGGALNLNAWDYDKTTTRGSNLSALMGGSAFSTSTSTSLSTGVGSSGTSDMESVSMQSATDSATEAGGTTSEELEQQKELPQKIYEALYVGSEDQTVATLLQEINNRLDPQRVFYTAIAGVLTSDAVKQVTNLSSQLSSVSVTSSSGDTENNNITGVSESMKDPIKALTGDSSLTKEDAAMNFETVIANAVAMGLQQYGFSGSFAIPVSLTSMTPGGGA